MVRISGENQFVVFKILLDEVGYQSRTNKPFSEFDDNRRKKLSEEIADSKGVPPEASPISSSTLRDYWYRYKGRPKYPFKADSEKLSVLTEFIDEGTWDDFYKKHGDGSPAPKSWSFYNDTDIYTSLATVKMELKEIINEKALCIKGKPDDHVLLFDLGICHLLLENYNEAYEIFAKGVQYDTFNGQYHFFLALSLLGGKRPFRHLKDTIDKSLRLLQKAIHLEPAREDFLSLERLIYLDFHERIGYDYPPLRALPSLPNRQTTLLLSKCVNLSESDINKLLLSV
ncbi:hypothetical protein QQ020_21740 [Fulvivirgaceae bacterium BMA12]|uniref:Tetratricopeptide repeat protein n=1 Tax=Agaribacillus aureus TaxID=3051825 RepID=A0ABT8LEF4_9BACT|nr:hypothetical protein [Fulvivirgaceae bacterium BMA12]